MWLNNVIYFVFFCEYFEIIEGDLKFFLSFKENNYVEKIIG